MQITDKNLFKRIMDSRSKEREIIADIIRDLEEFDQRRLYCDYKCSSMFKFCVKFMGYSESEAYLRINAYKLIRKLPETREKIETGEISITNASAALNLMGKLPEQEAEILEIVTDSTTREAKHELNDLAVKSGIKKEQEVETKKRDVSRAQTELKIYLDKALVEKMDFIKSKHRITDEKELIALLITKEEHRLNPARTPIAPMKCRTKNPRVISPAKKHEVYKRADSKCENCDSVYSLEIDHIIAVSLGGTNSLDNLRLLCKQCNQREFIKINKTGHAMMAR